MLKNTYKLRIHKDSWNTEWFIFWVERGFSATCREKWIVRAGIFFLIFMIAPYFFRLLKCVWGFYSSRETEINLIPQLVKHKLLLKHGIFLRHFRKRHPWAFSWPLLVTTILRSLRVAYYLTQFNQPTQFLGINHEISRMCYFSCVIFVLWGLSIILI